MITRNGLPLNFSRASRLTSIGGVANYEYDGHGRRTTQWRSDGTVRVSLYTLDGRLQGEADNRAVGSTDYMYLGSTLVARRFQHWSGISPVVTYHHSDALGSPVAVSNAGGQLQSREWYTSYGAPADGATEDQIGYTGHQSDPVRGLVYAQQRYYDPVIGRFLSVDPISASSLNGGNFNRYWYGKNNPYRFTDPDGLLAMPAGRSSCHMANACLNGGQSRARASQERQYAAAKNDPSKRQQNIDRMHAQSGSSGTSPTYDPNLIEDAGAVDSIDGSWSIGPKAFDYENAADLGSVIFHEQIHKSQFQMFQDFHHMAQDNRDNVLEYEAHIRTLSGENPFRSRMSNLYRATSEKAIVGHLGEMNSINRAVALSGGTCATNYCSGGGE